MGPSLAAHQEQRVREVRDISHGSCGSHDLIQQAASDQLRITARDRPLAVIAQLRSDVPSKLGADIQPLNTFRHAIGETPKARRK